MTDLEERLRAVAPMPPPDIDLDVLHGLASARHRTQRHRRASIAAVATIGVVVVLVASLLSFHDTSEPARRIDTSRPEVTWTRLPGIDGAVNDVVSGAGVTVAVGAFAQGAAIWTSTDGTSWQLTYVKPPSQIDVCQSSACKRQDAQSSMFRVAYGDGRFVAVGSIDGANAVQLGLAMTSTDGVTWREADATAFDPPRRPNSNLGSMVRDVAYYHGAFVAVGDLYTDNRDQQAGLSPALWRSRDGVRWQRRVLDLGDGFDPYMTGIAISDGLLLASGGYEHGYGAWTTRDLREWSFQPINERGGQRIVAVPQGFVAAGVTCVPASRCGGRVQKVPPRYEPMLWFSPDGTHWRVALRLASGQLSPDTGFGPVGVIGDTIVALGSRSTATHQQPLVYVSSDGEHWTEDRDAQLFPDGATVSGSGQRSDTFLTFGTTPDRQSVLWLASR
jgi:hypothetical protein